MSLSTAQKAGFAAAALVASHVAGLFAGIEHDVSPGFARTSLDIFHFLPESAVSAIKEAQNGSESDRIAAKAVCTFLNQGISESSDHDVLVEQISSELQPQDRTFPGVEAVISSLATKLEGVSQPGAAGHIYRQACFGFG